MRRCRTALIIGAFLALLPQAPLHAQAGPVAASVLAGDTDLQRFYGLYGQRLFWSEASWSIAADFLAKAANEGLDPARYRVAQGADAPARDRMRTQAVLSYARDLRLGRAELRGIDRDVALPPSVFDPAAALLAARDAAAVAAFLASLAPPSPEYRQLRLALAHYRAIAAAGGWPRLATGAAMDEVQRRVAMEYPSLAGQPAGAALKQFKDRHGLAADGALSPATLAALNVTAGERVRQLEANMERWRWLPRPLEASRLMVNVPAATLTLLLEERPVLTSRVIVGKPATPTPILRADSVGVTVNPPWTVPHSIAVKEMLPRLKRNPSWLKSQNIILLNGPAGDPHGLSVNWRALGPGNFPYRLQQLPGPDNALGLVKLELPNRFDVYLHDTPGKAAFAGARRALSHGCVRVEQIVPLAAQALSPDTRDAAERIRLAIAEGKTRTLPLPRATPVYVLYWTASADAAGEARFWPDLYGRDRRQLQRLPAGEVRVAALIEKCPAG
jgi:murein L,D-transpeptidase YcbB/YkuD